MSGPGSDRGASAAVLEERVSAIVAREGGGRVSQELRLVCGHQGCDWSIEGPAGEVFAELAGHRLSAHGVVTAPGRARRRGQPVILGRLSAGDHNRAMGERAPRTRVPEPVMVEDEPVEPGDEPDLEAADEILVDA